MSFDLEQYISNYSGLTKIKRLIFIADNSTELRKEAARLAIQELKNGVNTLLYKEVLEKYGNEVGHTFDANWVATVDQEAQKRLEKLEIN
jgi:COP9 signalosome complex subunit 1